MKITNVGRQMEVSEKLKDMVAKKLAKFDKFFAKEGTATVTFSRKHGKECLEVTINAARTLFRSEVEADSFRDALDRAVETIERQIRKNKTKLAKKLREGALTQEIPGELPSDQEEDSGTIIRTKHFQLEPMTPEEAVMQMNLLGHTFFVFLNMETNTTCVAYCRKDGNYGLIEPES